MAQISNSEYRIETRAEHIQQQISRLRAELPKANTLENLKRLFGCIDLTTLSVDDTPDRVRQMALKVNQFHSFPRHVGIPNVAALCVYPAMVPHVRESLQARGVELASVAGGFPAAQTFWEIKVGETNLAVKAGATEIDMVISVGTFLSGDYSTVLEEIRQVKKAAGAARLKVILETGVLVNLEAIKKASILAIAGGADFIKTSTGKTPVSATPEAAWVMVSAIAEHFRLTGERVGFKPAGGLSTSQDALLYLLIVKELLGNTWLTPEFFRLGASRLANQLLEDIMRLSPQGKHLDASYF